MTYKRHPAEVTADRLVEALEKWPEAFTDGHDREAVGHIIYVLENIASGDVE